MKVGTLIYDPSEDLFDILYAGDGQDRYGGLSCGTPMDVWFKGQWISTRIEYADAWYLVGISCQTLSGLQIRI